MTLSAGQPGVWGLFESRVADAPNAIALDDGITRMTYQELAARALNVAGCMIAVGLRHGDRVAWLSRNSIDCVVVELAAARCGVICAALNWRLGDRELAHCISLVSPKLLLTQHDLQASLLQPHSALATDELPVMTVSELCDLEPNLLASREGRGEDGLVILYTSGTTGLPKGALVSHRATVARAAAFVSDLGLEPGANFVAWAPFYHMASTDHALATLLRGGTVFVVDGYQPSLLIEILAQYKIGWFVVMPGMIADFAKQCVAAALQPKGITCIGAMADLVPRDDLAKITHALNAPYLNSFGATETGLPPATRSVVAIGDAPDRLPKRQSAFVEIRLVDAEDRDVPIGEAGELALRGPTLFSGYWNAKETNVYDFRGGWFHMGDVMRRNKDGTLEYVDRVKYMIKSGGENIYPAEIEQVLLTHPDVEQAIVVRKVDKEWGEVPVAFVVGIASEHELAALCKADLSTYKWPRKFIFVEDTELPRSTTGKIQRHLLEARLSG
ncbi:AMP-dependent synthetase and ligase [Ahrensia sp. R2A130]|nr:AMP-dependent synthetase and ligase [Ahrensia sp. R2A130]